MDMVEMKVEEDGQVMLSYAFKNIAQATEMFIYLRDFFPHGTFVIQPLRH